MTQQECAPSQLVPPHTYPNGSSSPETVPEHSASLHRNYGYASDLSKHSGTISEKLSSRRFRRGEVLVRLRGACPELDSGVLAFNENCTIPRKVFSFYVLSAFSFPLLLSHTSCTFATILLLLSLVKQ